MLGNHVHGVQIYRVRSLGRGSKKGRKRVKIPKGKTLTKEKT